MSLRVALVFPEHRDGRAAEIHDTQGDETNVPAELFLERGVVMVALNPMPGGVAWEGRLSDLMGALAQGLAVMEEGIDAVKRSH